ncbi:hypothetical protein Pcinc_032890 [Petrolisthes cinctipes]|nr:hypothetical protein Pcinc_032890 [Petrolisthes cinctipes]
MTRGRATGYTAPSDGINDQFTLPPVFLFVVDTEVDKEELTAIKGSISMSLSFISPQALVGLITFDRDVTIYVMANTLQNDAYIFHGLTAPSTKTVQRHLQVELLMTSMAQTYGQATQSSGNKFLRPLIDCEAQLQEILYGLERKDRRVHKGKRPLRASGTALSIALSLLELSYPKNTGSGRVFTFLGGPCSYGPGMVVDDDLINSIRSHHDIDTNNCPYLKKTTRFYENLAKSACGNGYVVDLLASSINQVGLYEMKSFANYTGGHMVLCESFSSPQFLTSYQRLFSRDEQGNLEMAFNATMEVKTSRELKVDNVLSPCVACNESGQTVAAGFELNNKNINKLKILCLTPRTNIFINFEVTASETSISQDNKCYIQFITRYQEPSGLQKVRVTTVSRVMADSQRESEMIQRYFDQETAAVLMARLAIYKSEKSLLSGPDVLRYVDCKLIRLSERFAVCSNNDNKTCWFPDYFSLYPQFMYHFRRSHFIQLFNNSPDQTTFYRCMLNRENVIECLTMIQPVLYRYSISSTEAVLLDTSSIQPDCMLLLDTYFVVLIYTGKTIVAWKKEKYHERNGYAHIKELLDRPVQDAQEILARRSIYPQYTETQEGGSQARILLSKVNPTHTHNNTMIIGDSNSSSSSSNSNSNSVSSVLTDDIDLQLFMQHLKEQVKKDLQVLGHKKK